MPPPATEIILNRLLWVGIGFLFLGFTLLKYKMALPEGGSRKKVEADAPETRRAGRVFDEPEPRRAAARVVGIDQSVQVVVVAVAARVTGQDAHPANGGPSAARPEPVLPPRATRPWSGARRRTWPGRPLGQRR